MWLVQCRCQLKRYIFKLGLTLSRNTFQFLPEVKTVASFLRHQYEPGLDQVVPVPVPVQVPLDHASLQPQSHGLPIDVMANAE